MKEFSVLSVKLSGQLNTQNSTLNIWNLIKPHPSPEVEFDLRENYRFRAGLGMILLP